MVDTYKRENFLNQINQARNDELKKDRGNTHMVIVASANDSNFIHCCFVDTDNKDEAFDWVRYYYKCLGDKNNHYPIDFLPIRDEIRIKKIPINTCLECKSCKTERDYTSDSFEMCFKWTCKIENKDIRRFVDATDRRKFIPDWCPLEDY